MEAVCEVRGQKGRQSKNTETQQFERMASGDMVSEKQEKGV